MILSEKSLEKLRNLINEESEYRGGPKLVSFFNNLGSTDVYGQGFPSRGSYTDNKLNKINGTPEIDKCIKSLFAPINFIGKVNILDELIADFNQYIIFDKWKVIRNGQEITFAKADKVIFDVKQPDLNEDNFLERDFREVSIENIDLDGLIIDNLKNRYEEIQKCLNAKAPLATIFLCGSTLEGILLGVALKNPKDFNQSKSSPKESATGKVRQFHEWSLSNFIDVASDLGYLKEDVKKFSHTLRDFRNYIHPYEQLSSNFSPNEHTAKICWQVLKAVIFQLSIK